MLKRACTSNTDLSVEVIRRWLPQLSQPEGVTG
jgi:hypothetical protein